MKGVGDDIIEIVLLGNFTNAFRLEGSRLWYLSYGSY